MDRQTATNKIARIVNAIEAGKFPSRVRELYVFGSYARGALNPRDLDLIVIHDPVPELLKKIKADLVKKYGKSPLHWPRGQWPSEKFKTKMRAVMRYPGEKMDILLATSHKEVEEMGDNIANAVKVLIWSDSDRDWQAKLESIRPDPSAKRHERPHFANVKRFHFYHVSTMVNITEAITQGFLKLTRLDAKSINPVLNPLYQEWNDWWTEHAVMGKKSMQLLSLGMWWMQQQRGQANCPPHAPDHRGVMHSNNWKYVVYFGNPPLYAPVYDLCLSDHRRVRLCLIPHFKKDDANELFLFERGERRDTKALEEIMKRD